MRKEVAHGSQRTGSIDELSVQLRGEQRLRQLSEELLHQAGHAVDVVVKVLGAGEVDLRGVYANN